MEADLSSLLLCVNIATFISLFVPVDDATLPM
jgi:hypothetical protein